jgi:hypothetical protein
VWADPSDAALFAWRGGSGLKLQSVSGSRRAHFGGGVGGTAGGSRPIFLGLSSDSAEGGPKESVPIDKIESFLPFRMKMRKRPLLLPRLDLFPLRKQLGVCGQRSNKALQEKLSGPL